MKHFSKVLFVYAKKLCFKMEQKYHSLRGIGINQCLKFKLCLKLFPKKGNYCLCNSIEFLAVFGRTLVTAGMRTDR